MQVYPWSPTFWVFVEGEEVVAWALLHSWDAYRLGALVLFTKDPAMRCFLLERWCGVKKTVEHTEQIVRRDPNIRGVALERLRIDAVGLAIMLPLVSFVAPPVVAGDAAERERELRAQLSAGVEHAPMIVDGDYANLAAMLDAATAEVARESGAAITYEISPKEALPAHRAHITFRVRGDRKFRFWKYPPSSVGTAHQYCCLPAYHPVRTGAKSVLTINGDTSAAIGRHELGIDSIEYPRGALRTPGAPSLVQCSWSRTRHPFRAEGATFVMEMNLPYALSVASRVSLVEVLLGALGHGPRYVQVSGGFHAPFSLGDNVSTMCKAFRSAYGNADARPLPQMSGAEAELVWEYLTLQDEGALAESVVPERLHAWRLLEHYADEIAEWRAGGDPRERKQRESFDRIFAHTPQ
ncbi:hypothetical protein HYV74_01715 [Candidatus Uhrbacteria bacterium]|nr:hypothetical protein [Candidatus Uhrbacteria bacterium]